MLILFYSNFGKEIKNLIDDLTSFVLEDRKETDTAIPVTPVFNIKINFDASLDNGKNKNFCS